MTMTGETGRLLTYKDACRGALKAARLAVERWAAHGRLGAWPHGHGMIAHCVRSGCYPRPLCRDVRVLRLGMSKNGHINANRHKLRSR